MPIDKKKIRDLAAQIGREFRPQQVILFGSYAYGTPTDDEEMRRLAWNDFFLKEVTERGEVLYESSRT